MWVLAGTNPISSAYAEMNNLAENVIDYFEPIILSLRHLLDWIEQVLPTITPKQKPWGSALLIGLYSNESLPQGTVHLLGSHWVL